jgi:hypothetical protein
MGKRNVNGIGDVITTIRQNKSTLNKSLGGSKRAPFLCKKPKRSDSGKVVVRTKRILPPSLVRIIAAGGTAATIARQNKLAGALRVDEIHEKRGCPPAVSISSAAKTALDLYSIALGCSLLAKANVIRQELSSLSRINAAQAHLAVSALVHDLSVGSEEPIMVPPAPPPRTAAEEEAEEVEEEKAAEAEEAEEEAALEKAEAEDAAAPADETMEEEEEEAEDAEE